MKDKTIYLDQRGNPPKEKKKPSKNLQSMIQKLPPVEIEAVDLEQLILQLVLETDQDKIKIDGLKILVEMKKNERKKKHGDDLLDLLGDD